MSQSLGGVSGGTMMRSSALCPSAVWLSAMWPSAVSCGSLLALSGGVFRGGLRWCALCSGVSIEAVVRLARAHFHKSVKV